jgi:hypothetical protein
MTGRQCAAVCLLLLAGCGGGKDVPPPAPDTESSTDDDQGMTMSAGNLELYYHAPGPTGTEARKPVFLLRAERFDFEPGAERYAFEDAHIEIAEDETREAIVLDGTRGNYEVGREARLEGGVTVQMGTTRIEVEDIVYELPGESVPGSLYTDSPVVLDSPARSLRASSLRMDPETKRLIMMNATGSLALGDVEP